MATLKELKNIKIVDAHSTSNMQILEFSPPDGIRLQKGTPLRVLATATATSPLKKKTRFTYDSAVVHTVKDGIVQIVLPKQIDARFTYDVEIPLETEAKGRTLYSIKLLQRFRKKRKP